MQVESRGPFTKGDAIRATGQRSHRAVKAGYSSENVKSSSRGQNEAFELDGGAHRSFLHHALDDAHAFIG